MTFPEAASGRTAADDPGLRGSMSSGTPLGQMRALALVFCAVPVLVGALLPFLLRESGPGLGVPVGVVVVVFVAMTGVLAQYLAIPRQFAPVLAGDTDSAPHHAPDDAHQGTSDEAVREGVQQLRAAMFLRVALSETPVLVGFVMSFATNSPVPYLVGFVLGWPAMVLAVPTTRQVERAHRRMESAGVRVPLWDALLVPRQ